MREIFKLEPATPHAERYCLVRGKEFLIKIFATPTKWSEEGERCWVGQDLLYNKSVT